MNVFGSTLVSWVVRRWVQIIVFRCCCFFFVGGAGLVLGGRNPPFCDRRLRVLLFAWVAVDAAPSLAVFCFCVVVVVVVDVVFIVGPRRGRRMGPSGWQRG